MELDTNSRAELEKSLAHWKRELKQAQAKRPKRHADYEAVARRIQIARATIERRSKQLESLPGPRAKTIKLALEYVGTRESPPDSNRGHLVDSWQRRFGIVGQPWCGAFAGSMVERGGGNVTPRIVYCPYIYADASAGRNGLDHVVWHGKFTRPYAIGHTGDLVLFDFGGSTIAHVGLLAKPWKGWGPLATVEGNTSFGAGGSQDNGGAVARRTRDVSLVHSIVAPLY